MSGFYCFATAPNGPGYSRNCHRTSARTCTQTCSAGYVDNNNGAGQTYTCVSSTMTGTPLRCTPLDCSSSVPAGPEYSTNCDDLSTDGSCTQSCQLGSRPSSNQEWILLGYNVSMDSECFSYVNSVCYVERCALNHYLNDSHVIMLFLLRCCHYHFHLL